MVSLAQIPLGLIAFILMTVAPPWAVPVWVLSVAIDGLDGALARHLGMASRYGALVDQYADHARESIIVAGLAWAGALNGAWATLYVLTYIGVNITLLLCNIHSVPLPLSVKTIFILYPAILVYLLMGVNALDAAALLMIAIQSLTISIGLRRLRPVLQGSIA
jgi:phosphatidylglycerophosphate synthase